MSSTTSRLQIPLLTPEPERPTISVVIVVWNAKRYVIECLGSLREHCRDICDEVIVVDNASTDGTPELIAELFGDFKLIRNCENLGFAKANNIGIAQSSGEYVCLVNSDVKFTDDCLTPMLNFLFQHPDVGMVGPKMLSVDGAVRRSTMRFPTIWNQFCRALGLDIVFKKSRLFGGLLMKDFDHMTTAPVEVLNGWFVVVRRRALNRVGLLDPQFFMYAEDLDWCYRFWQSNEKVVFFGKAGAIHYGGASSAKAPLRFYLEQCYANWQYWQKHHGLLSQMAFLGTLALYHCIRLFNAIVRYLLSLGKRSENLDNVRRNVTCLRWVYKPQLSPLQMGIDLESGPQANLP